MKTYITHPSDNKLTNGVFYSDSDDYKKAIDYKNINTECKKSTYVHSKLKQTTLLNQEQ